VVSEWVTDFGAETCSDTQNELYAGALKLKRHEPQGMATCVYVIWNGDAPQAKDCEVRYQTRISLDVAAHSMGFAHDASVFDGWSGNEIMLILQQKRAPMLPFNHVAVIYASEEDLERADEAIRLEALATAGLGWPTVKPRRSTPCDVFSCRHLTNGIMPPCRC